MIDRGLLSNVVRILLRVAPDASDPSISVLKVVWQDPAYEHTTIYLIGWLQSSLVQQKVLTIDDVREINNGLFVEVTS
jgi:hypothetical protein